mmetsp:Transcript_8713/g.12802  ORF Transcript_8713/g.12802 Transcript_8713/m.12802 type:complete len:402 (+) Transcript_8713:182-1387(+)
MQMQTLYLAPFMASCTKSNFLFDASFLALFGSSINAKLVATPDPPIPPMMFTFAPILAFGGTPPIPCCCCCIILNLCGLLAICICCICACIIIICCCCCCITCAICGVTFPIDCCMCDDGDDNVEAANGLPLPPPGPRLRSGSKDALAVASGADMAAATPIPAPPGTAEEFMKLNPDAEGGALVLSTFSFSALGLTLASIPAPDVVDMDVNVDGCLMVISPNKPAFVDWLSAAAEAAPPAPTPKKSLASCISDDVDGAAVGMGMGGTAGATVGGTPIEAEGGSTVESDCLTVMPPNKLADATVAVAICPGGAGGGCTGGTGGASMGIGGGASIMGGMGGATSSSKSNKFGAATGTGTGAGAMGTTAGAEDGGIATAGTFAKASNPKAFKTFLAGSLTALLE